MLSRTEQLKQEFDKRQARYKQAIKYTARYEGGELTIFNGLGEKKVTLKNVTMTTTEVADLLHRMRRRAKSESSIGAAQAKQKQRDMERLDTLYGESGHHFQIRTGEELDKGGLENGR